MEFNDVRLSSYCMMIIIIILCMCLVRDEVAENSDKFSAVTAFPGLTRLYHRMQIREPHLEPSTEADAATKKRICRSITRSVYFDLKYEEDPIDVEEAREKLTQRMEDETKDLPRSRLLERVLRDYDEGATFTYRTRLTLFSTEGGESEEFAFACASIDQNVDGGVNVYYISDSYNARVASDGPTVGRTDARFVCAIIASRCWLVALAEETAIVYPGLFYSEMYVLQDIYKQMRKSYQMAENESDDPLCKLTVGEKLRVCASVLNALYFADHVEFNPDPYIFQGKCEKNEVSFLSAGYDDMMDIDEAYDTTNTNTKSVYYEWMLFCSADSMANGTEGKAYFLSRAYHSHHVFVYVRDYWTGEYYVESIGGNVSPIIENELRPTDEGSTAGTTSPSLVDLLDTWYTDFEQFGFRYGSGEMKENLV